MSLFLFTFFLLYSALHFYFFLKLKHAYTINFKTGTFVAALFIVLIIAPIITRLAERAGYIGFALFTAYSGYTWMVVIFIFFSFSLCMDLLRFFVYASGFFAKFDVSRFVHADRFFFILPLVLSLIISSYGFYEARQIRIKKIVFETHKIKKGIAPLRIVQISDVHIGLILGKGAIERIADKINEIRPDILVSTGDLIDGRFTDLKASIEPLKLINPAYGKFAVTGNHEFYAGIKTSTDLMEKAGFEILRGRGVTVGDIINIAGVDDAAGVDFTNSFVIEGSMLAKLPQGKFTLFLKHRPVIEDSAAGLFDLQLSGHTHSGQIYPFRYIVKIFFPYCSGYYGISDKSYLYTSSGTGTWGPPIRFLSPPEITVIELVNNS